MTKYYCCNDCGLVFPDYEAAHRKALVEDALAPWEFVDVCWECGSDDLTELDNCELCGNPITDNAVSDFCEECRVEIDRAFRCAFDTVHAAHGGEYTKLVRLMIDRAEECEFYY